MMSIEAYEKDDFKQYIIMWQETIGKDNKRRGNISEIIATNEAKRARYGVVDLNVLQLHQ